jgi:1-acyl-sn-glycerol-3-phosphate acyltransferase
MGTPNGTPLPVQLWLAYWRIQQRYHRYSVEGLEHLDGPRAAVVVGYHGRPIAYDMCMLTVALYDRLGYLPHAMFHRMLGEIPVLRKWFVEDMGFVTTDDAHLAAAVERGEHIVITPGGAREACRSFRQRYQVHWGEHLGYLRIALKYGLRIVPVGAAGADDGYWGLNDAQVLGRLIGLKGVWASLPWVAIGPLGICPFSPKFPVRMRQLIGEPIDPRANGDVSPDDRAGLLRIHRRVTAAVQNLLDRARGLASASAP